MTNAEALRDGRTRRRRTTRCTECSTGAAPPQSWRARIGALRNLPPFLRLVWQTSPALTLGVSALRIARALLPIATLYVGKLIIDEVVALARAPDGGEDLAQWLAAGLLDRIAWLLALEFGLAIASDVLGRAVSLLDSLLSERFSNETSLRLMEHAATLDLEDFEDSELQDRLERARRQAGGRTSLIGQMFAQAQDVVTIVSFAAGLLVYAPWLIVLLAVALVPAFIGEAHFNAQSYALNYARAAERRELDYVRQTGASAETAKEVKIFGLNGFLIERYRRSRRVSSTPTGASRCGARDGAACSPRSERSPTTSPTRTSCGARSTASSRSATSPFSPDRSGGCEPAREPAARILAGGRPGALPRRPVFVLRDTPEIICPPNPRPFPARVREGFVFENVGFRYPGAERWAVRDLSFRLAAGETLALVGENGAGKTTVVKLLARLYDPDEGRILLDGHDLREYDLFALRANIGVIFQDFVRYHLTAADNIAVGRIEARDDRARIADAAQRVSPTR